MAYAATGHRTRRWPLVAAAVLGLGSLVAAAAAVAALLPSLNRQHDIPTRLTCARNLRMVGQAVQMYANENKGVFPPDSAALLLTQDLTAREFVCDATDDAPAEGESVQEKAANLTAAKGHLSYVYVGKGLTLKSPPGAVVAYEPLSNHGDGMNVLLADGRVQWLDAKLGQKLSAELAAGHNPPRALSVPQGKLLVGESDLRGGALDSQSRRGTAGELCDPAPPRILPSFRQAIRASHARHLACSTPAWGNHWRRSSSLIAIQKLRESEYRSEP
jgi:prepilin-type processing-associated H-X9-DG protein